MLFKDRILVENIFPVIYYASGRKELKLPKQPKFDDVSSEKIESFWDYFAKRLGEGITRLRRQGLHREYLERTEDLPTIRGKIDITGTIRNVVAQRKLISCEYDELSENTLNNQILKTTAMLLLREETVQKDLKGILRREMRYFSRVDEINPATIQWSRIRYHKNNSSYRELIFFCEFIIKNLLLTEHGKHKLKRFFDEKQMAALYEKFILGYYEEEFNKKRKRNREKELQVGATQIEWAVAEDNNPEKLPKMRSDITLSYLVRGKEHEYYKVLIVDAKWYKTILQPRKQAGKEDNVIKNTENTKDVTVDSEGTGDEEGNDRKIRSAHLYQILSYVKNKEADKKHLHNLPRKVSGMLLYARTNEKEISKLETNKIGEYKICKNEIHVRTLDLREKFDDKTDKSVKAQLDGIVREFFPEIFQKSTP